MAVYGEDEFLCFMYYDDFATPWHDQRRRYYNIWAYPTIKFNGYCDESCGGDDPPTSSQDYADLFANVIDEELTRPSLLRMSVGLDIVGDTGTVAGQIEALDTVTDALVHVAIYEEPGPRQPHVVRWFPVYREPLTALSIGQTQQISGTFTIDPDWVAGDLHAVLFVQNAYASHGPMILAGLGPGEDNTTQAVLSRQLTWFSWDYGYGVLSYFPCYGIEKYGINPATGDIDGDGFDEIITGPGPGAVFGPHVRSFEFDGTPVPGVGFFAYGTLKYGVNVAGGDIDGDGCDEIITGAGPGTVFGPHVRAWDHDDSGTVTSKSDVSFFAYGTPKYGVNVCCGDIDGDGYDEMVTGAGPGTVYGPHVRGWNYDNSAIESMPGVSFFAYGTNQFGVNVACGDVDGDGIDEILTGAGPGAVFGPHVRGWNVDGAATVPISGISFMAFEDTRWGVNVGSGDLDNDGTTEIITGRGEGPDFDSTVRVFSFDGSTVAQEAEYLSFHFFGETTHGANIAVGHFGDEPED